jgi:hypothetical protein
MHTHPTPSSAHVCTPAQGQAPGVPRILRNLRARLERWELQHLRAHAAELADRLEQAHQRIDALEADNLRAWEAADGWREDAMNLARDLEDHGVQVGLTQDGALVTMPSTDEVGLEQQVARQVTPGEKLSLPELLTRLGLPNSIGAEAALRAALVRLGYTKVREVSGLRRHLWAAPAAAHPGCQCAPHEVPGTQPPPHRASHPLAAHGAPHQPKTPPQAAQPGQIAPHQTRVASPPPVDNTDSSLATEGGAA